ncbi:MAG: 4Fe-4S binding protein [Chloroflexota bacterium]
MKNLIGPVFTIQYPSKRIGLFKALNYHKQSPISFMRNQPKEFMKALLGQHEVAEYPTQAPRFRGQDFNWFEDRCTGCASCAKYCPLGIIKIETKSGSRDEQEGTSYDIDVFDIDIGRCMFCGLCVEACPFDALHMGSGFERAHEKREGLVIPVDDLRKAEKTPSTWFRPQMEDKKYKPREKNAEIKDWHDIGRHEQPSDEDLTERWVNER